MIGACSRPRSRTSCPGWRSGSGSPSRHPARTDNSRAPPITLEFLWRNESFDEQMNELVSKEATDTIEAIKGTLAPVAVSLHAEADSFIEISQRLMNDTADRYGPEHVAFILLGMAGVRLALASGVDSITKQKEMRQLARRLRGERAAGASRSVSSQAHPGARQSRRV